jgi:AcrR family transcriptional regulator
MAKKKALRQDIEASEISGLSPRDRILRTVTDLFYIHGIRAVGVDRIIEQSGVAKMTFYKHFPSKNALVAEYLKSKDEKWLSALETISKDSGKSPLDRILSLFDIMENIVGAENYQGCPFIKGLAEFGPDEDASQIQEQIASHFSRTRDLITQFVRDLQPKKRPEQIVQIIMTLLTGTLVVAQVYKEEPVAKINKEAARTLLLGIIRET